MDHESSSDDEIELLRPPGVDERLNNGDLLDFEASVNPNFYLRRGPSEDSSIDPGSIHALQTAFSSLQHKLKDKSRKYNELLQKNKLMQKALFDINKQDHLRQSRSMDDICTQESSIVHAAGAGAGAGCSPEDETAIAAQRARQGYISHLEREVLRNNNVIVRCNEEIQRLKRTADERDREKKGYLQKIEQLEAELEMITVTSEDDIREKQKRIEELQRSQKYLQEENYAQKMKIEMLEKNSSKDAEIQDLKSKLTVADNEMKKLTLMYRDNDKKMCEQEEELSRLKAQCTQYEIEADINRKRSRKISEGLDDIDGDTDTLMKALDMIQSQRSEVTCLLTQLQQQKVLISELNALNEKDVKPVCKVRGTSQEERGMAQGASIHVYRDPYRMEQTYVNTQPVQEDQSSQRDVSPKTRRQSDRGDYRGMDKRPMPTSPRLRESVMTTGNTHVTQMLANEDTPAARMQNPAGNNVFDCSGPGLHLNLRNQVQTEQPQYMNITAAQGSNTRRDVTTNDLANRRSTSPRARVYQYPNADTASAQVVPNSNIDGGARPKMNSNSDNFLNLHYNNIEAGSSNMALSRISNRMTQSAVMLRNDSITDNSAMSRSLYSPSSPVESNTPSPPIRKDLHMLSQHEPVGQMQERQAEALGRNNYRTTNNVPDYENICNIKTYADAHRPIEENEDTVIVNNVPDNQDDNNINRITPANNTVPENNPVGSSEVSALKICPVCNLEYSRLTMDQFQTHVFECFDTCEEPATMQPNANTSCDDERNCPMCGEGFPLTIPQETYEQHVLGHFGEEPMIERFEMLNS